MTVTNDPSKKSQEARQEEQEWQSEQDNSYYDYNFDGTTDVGGTGDVPEYPNAPSYPPPNPGPNPYGSGAPNPGTKNLASGSGFSPPTGDQSQQVMQDLIGQGLSNTQIKQQMQAQGYPPPTDAAINYAKNYGSPNTNSAVLPGAYANSYGSGPQAKLLSKAYGTPGFQNYMDQQQMANEAKGMARDMKKKDGEAKVKIHMILLQIMMGDLVGALRSYSLLMDRDLREFSRLIVGKLDKVRSARSTVIRNFARTQPPQAYAGSNPQTAARTQDKSAKYTQYVQMSTQLMNELQNTERELVDALQTQKKDLDNFLQSYASLRDDDKRVSERVMTMR